MHTVRGRTNTSGPTLTLNANQARNANSKIYAHFHYVTNCTWNSIGLSFWTDLVDSLGGHMLGFFGNSPCIKLPNTELFFRNASNALDLITARYWMQIK